ncbi:putative pentatricopeptide repeat-containing protein, chloroplastic [Iris pallida]|uniref:Pentatricopeptide repeat-containing protein, chloroplastic n=1 Tax=Iris pallida TaxID=29817 RepID=A0AAX6IEW1_IRIPA|nr:putative pentatricopeptide repeat-containing protein, chloroplastic [Iris pallida]KAJ6852147.1 putative pentatricopeptide repeat-containing protein, chloroplastic [Iris pallida]
MSSQNATKICQFRNIPAHQLFDKIPTPISSIILSIGNLGSNELNHCVHAVAIKLGYESDASVATALVGFYSSVNKLGSAKRAYDSAPTKDLILCSSLVSAFCKNARFVEAIDTFRSMRDLNICPNGVSLLSPLTACANSRALLCGKQIHGFAVVKGCCSDARVQNSILDMYLKCGELDVAMLVFDGINAKDGISWKNMILGLIASGQPVKAVLLFSRMRSCMVEVDEMILRNVIGAWSQVGYLKFGFGLHCLVIKSGLSVSVPIGTSLLKMYAEFREVETAQALFNQLAYRDHIAWSAIISVYSQRMPVLALELFMQMASAKIEANEITLVSLLQACSSMEAQELGRSVHARTLRLYYDSNMFINSALIDFYCKIGRLRQGEILFGKLQHRDVVCWSSMIKGYGINGQGEQAIKTFTSMLDHGLMSNEVVFVSLLSACAHCGLLDEGWKWFYSMEEKFDISPTLTHYTCIVDMLGRLGDLGRAVEFIQRMPMEPDMFVWNALLSWFRTAHDNIKIAEIAVEELMRLDPNNPTYYVTLANIYSKLGQWEDAEGVRLLMEDRGLRKITGYSMV